MDEKPNRPDTLVLYTEDEAGATVALTAKRRHRYPSRFVTMFVETMNTLAGWDRPPAYHRTLWHLLSVLDPIQWRHISAREISERTGLAPASVSRALAMLEADRMVIAEGRTANKRRRLNNQLGWASSAEKYSDTTADRPPEDARGR